MRKKYNEKFLSIKEMIDKVKRDKRPLNMIKIETTGPNINRDEICVISVIELNIMSKMHITNMYNKIVKTKVPMTQEMTRRTGITDDITREGTNIKEVLLDVQSFLGGNATVCGFNMSDYIYPFLYKAMRQTGIQLDIKDIFNIEDMAKGIVAPSKKLYKDGYTEYALCKLFGEEDDVLGNISLLNKFYKRLPETKDIEAEKQEKILNAIVVRDDENGYFII